MRLVALACGLWTAAACSSGQRDAGPDAAAPEVAAPAVPTPEVPVVERSDADARVEIAVPDAALDADDRPDAAIEPTGFAPCLAPPERMVCIPGGAYRRGSETGEADERPRHAVTVSTFYIDRYEVTNAEYRPCIDAGVCRLMHHYDGFEGDDQPVVAVDWYNAAAYCRWIGKRLPTEAEWEKAARGTDERIYPWGDEPPTCARAAFRGCLPATTRPVGSFPPGAWGIFDMAGNANEFVNDWYAPCYSGCRNECGDDCAGTDPLGPCDGTLECPGHEKKVLKGGSWFWESFQNRGSHRRGMRIDASGHRLGMRCAYGSNPDGAPTAALPVHVPPTADPPPGAMPDVEVPPLTAEQRAIFWSVPEEALDRPPIDERHYVQSNEPEHDDWFLFVDGVGGGYLGVGSDQNYTLLAHARSEFVWLMDYDVVVTQAHRIFRALILASESPEAFLGRWERREAGTTTRLLEESCAGDADVRELVDLYLDAVPSVRSYFRRVAARNVEGYPSSWLADPALYRYVRRMFETDRIRIVKGDLLGETLLAGIVAAQERLGVPMRVVYLSNAEQYFLYDDSFRAAFRSMPYDAASVILRTVSRPHPVYPRNVWHYQVEPAAHFVEALATAERCSDLHDDAIFEPEGGLSLLAAVMPE